MGRPFGSRRLLRRFRVGVLWGVWCLVGGCTVRFGDTVQGNCGNGVREGSEECDDGNTGDLDGCDDRCRVEEGWACFGDPSVCETTCGDGVAAGQEPCDGQDTRGLDCESLGLGDGELGCTAACVFDLGNCSIQAQCGNDRAEFPEECDGQDLNDTTCEELGFTGGQLFCTEDCTFDTGWCQAPVLCGDGVADGDEQCDGADLKGQTCAGLGLEGGELGCTGGCTYDVSGCTGQAVCGNLEVEFPELCDGENLNGTTCSDFGYYGGVLACLADCSNFDSSGCQGRCGDNAKNGPETCDGADLGGMTCASQGFYGGSLACLSDCSGFDTSGCQGLCGDNVKNGPEQCDGADLDGQTCASRGFYGGTLACRSDCSGFDEGGCWTEPMVRISEVNHGHPDWVEILNRSAVSVNLQGWRLAGSGYAGANPTTETIVLPWYNLDPGERVVVLDQLGGNGSPPEANPSAGTIQAHQNYAWGGLEPGAVLLRNGSNAPVDFVRWMGPDFSAPGSLPWNDSPGFLPSLDGDAATLSRVPEDQDNDAAGDFCVAAATPGGANSDCLAGASPGALLITEINVDGDEEIEIYNPGNTNVSLVGWSFHWVNQNGNPGGFTFPSFVLAAGQRAIIRDDGAYTNPSVTGNTIHCFDFDWGLGTPGSARLVDPEWHGVDFVRWGGSPGQPFAPDSWSDSPWPLSAPINALSLGRETLTDTNTAGDFCLQVSSFGAPNNGCQ